MKRCLQSALCVTLISGAVSSLPALAGMRDVVATQVQFYNVPASSGGEFPTPAHQLVHVLVRNAADTAAGNLAPCSGGSGGFCVPNLLEVTLKGITQSVVFPGLQPRAEAWVTVSLPAGSLSQCEKVTVNLFGTSQPGDVVFASTAREVWARLQGSTALCGFTPINRPIPLPVPPGL